MNNFEKVYTTQELNKNSIVTLVMRPLEESIMVPVSQIIDLMKRGENILFFSFKHDSIKINEFLVPALKQEPNPESITGGLSIFDIHQISPGEDLFDFIKKQVIDIKKILEKDGKGLSFIFIDYPLQELKNQKNFEKLREFKFTQNVTSILVSTLNMPIITANQLGDHDAGKKIVLEQPILAYQSDYIMGVGREKESFLKKIINFLLFWRKRSNFVLRILKNRNGSDGQKYRMNIDLEEFKTEIL